MFLDSKHLTNLLVLRRSVAKFDEDNQVDVQLCITVRFIHQWALWIVLLVVPVFPALLFNWIPFISDAYGLDEA